MFFRIQVAEPATRSPAPTTARSSGNSLTSTAGPASALSRRSGDPPPSWRPRPASGAQRLR